MKNIWTICSRELKSYFVSPIAYVVSAVWLGWMGFWFANILAQSQDSSLRNLFSVYIFLLILLAPALTMKLLAEEQRMGTIELLLTAPVHDWQIVVGKYLGSVILYLTMLIAPTLYYILILNFFGKPDFGPIATGYLGLTLLGASFLAIGMFTSSVTQNQVIAYVLGFIIMLFLWVADAGNNVFGAGRGSIVDIMSYITIRSHMDDFFAGVVDTRHIVYTLSVITISLFLTTQFVQSRRWR